MSGGKTTTISHRALDEIVKFKTALITDIGQFKTEVLRGMKDFAEKHNNLAAQVTALEGMLNNVSGFVASKTGEAQGDVDRRIALIARSLGHTDLNMLAVAEMLKEVFGQLTQFDALISKLHAATKMMLSNQYGKLTESGNAEPLTEDMVTQFKNALELAEGEIAEIKSNAEVWYKDVMKSAFAAARDNMAEQDKQAQEAHAAAQQRAKEDAERARANAAETKTVQDVIAQAAESERAITTTTSGGPGSDYPEGAEIWGG